MGQEKQQDRLPESVEKSLHHRPRISSKTSETGGQPYPSTSFNCNGCMSIMSTQLTPTMIWKGLLVKERHWTGHAVNLHFIQGAQLSANAERVFQETTGQLKPCLTAEMEAEFDFFLSEMGKWENGSELSVHAISSYWSSREHGCRYEND